MDPEMKLKVNYVNANMGQDIALDIVFQPGKSIKAIIVRAGVTSIIEGIIKRSGQETETLVKADIMGVKYDGLITVRQVRSVAI